MRLTNRIEKLEQARKLAEKHNPHQPDNIVILEYDDNRYFHATGEAGEGRTECPPDELERLRAEPDTTVIVIRWDDGPPPPDGQSLTLPAGVRDWYDSGPDGKDN